MRSGTLSIWEDDLAIDNGHDPHSGAIPVRLLLIAAQLNAVRLFRSLHRILMGSRPSDVRALRTMTHPTIGCLDPGIGLMGRIKLQLRRIFDTMYTLTVPVPDTGAAGVEPCMVNTVGTANTAIVCRNGVFGSCFKAMAERCGVRAKHVADEWSCAVSPEKLEYILQGNAVKVAAGMDEARVRGRLLDAFNLEVGTLVGEIWCISLMGTAGERYRSGVSHNARGRGIAGFCWGCGRVPITLRFLYARFHGFLLV